MGFNSEQLLGSGVQLTGTIGNNISSPSQGDIVITNSSSFARYLTLEQISTTDTALFLNISGGLKVSAFAEDEADGSPTTGTAINITGYPGNSFLQWSLGRHTYKFIAKRGDVPADDIIFLSPDNETRIYNFYVEWSGTAADLATNFVNKINEVKIDRLGEFGAAFKNFGIINIDTSQPFTSDFNGKTITNHSGSIVHTFSGGKDRYPSPGGIPINRNDGSQPTNLQPFIFNPRSLDIVVPPNTVDNYNTYRIRIATTTGTENLNKFRLRSAGGTGLFVSLVGF